MTVDQLKTDLEAIRAAIYFLERFHTGPVLQEADKAITWVLSDQAALAALADLLSGDNLLTILQALLHLFAAKGTGTPQALAAAAAQP